jgi:putative ABC transport system permease protein
MLPVVRRVVASIDPDLPVFDVRSLEAIAADAVASERFAVLLFGLFAALALALSVVGIYGVLAYTVAHRLPELGVRVALGARPAQLLQMVLAQGARMAAIGIVLGAGISIVASRWIRGMLFGVQPFDLVTLGAVAVLFGVVALVACVVPARRAAGVDPLTAIRND